MYSYKQDLGIIQKMLAGFVRSKVIDVAKLPEMDRIIKSSEEAQIRILNYSNLPLSTQRIIFGAHRNINTALKSMKEKLNTASLRHKNPTTAEQALELMDNLFNVATYLDTFSSQETANLDVIEKFSRLLYRKAMALGFCQDLQTQFKEAGISESQVKSFISNFGNNLAQELDIEEEVQSPIEDSN
jgi:hypothetical protein